MSNLILARNNPYEYVPDEFRDEFEEIIMNLYRVNATIEPEAQQVVSPDSLAMEAAFDGTHSNLMCFVFDDLILRYVRHLYIAESTTDAAFPVDVFLRGTEEDKFSAREYLHEVSEHLFEEMGIDVLQEVIHNESMRMFEHYSMLHGERTNPFEPNLMVVFEVPVQGVW